MNVFLDIETIPSQHPAAMAAVRASLKPPGTLKKPESIEAWWANEADQVAEELWRKQALDGGMWGEIVSIAMCTDTDGREWSTCRAPGEDEGDLLAEAFAMVARWQMEEADKLAPQARAWQASTFAVGHNAAFDLGFLWRRARVHGLLTPAWLPAPTARVGKDYGCTMTLWAGFGGKVSLDNLCRVLRIESPKADMDGSQVFDAWLAGEVRRIERYNLADAKAVREVWHRLQGAAVEVQA